MDYAQHFAYVIFFSEFTFFPFHMMILYLGDWLDSYLSCDLYWNSHFSHGMGNPR